MAQLERPQRQDMAQLERPQRQDMAQLERPQRQDNAPKSPTIHTMEQLLRGDVSKPKLSKSNSSSPNSAGSSPSSPFFPRMRHHDSEEDHGQNQKKSVLAKVKEKAKKLRHSLSGKKRHEDGNSTSPSWSAGQEEENAEYHGAPMYESEKAPEGYQENARQHQRGSPIFPQKHGPGREQAGEKTLSRSLSKKTSQTTIPTNSATATTATFSGLMNILTKPAPEKNQKPAYAEGSEPRTPHVITTKLKALALAKPAAPHNSSSTTAPSKTYKTSLSFGPSHTPSGLRTSSGPNPMASPPPSPPSSAPSVGNNTSPSSQIWDKGVSVKEYLMSKFEPGEDEKALSSVISETMSPRRTPGDVGVIEKVREAVTSLLRTEEPTKRAGTSTTPTPSQIPASTNTTRASSHIPVSSNAQEVVQEEDHGRTLQAN